MGAARSCAELQAAAETAREEAEEQADHAAVALESARELCEHACEHLGQCEEMEEFCREAAEYRAAFDEQRDKIESWSNSRGGGTARRSPFPHRRLSRVPPSVILFAGKHLWILLFPDENLTLEGKTGDLRNKPVFFRTVKRDPRICSQQARSVGQGAAAAG